MSLETAGRRRPHSESTGGVSELQPVERNTGKDERRYLVLLLMVLCLMRERQVRIVLQASHFGVLSGRGCQVTTAVPHSKK